MNSGQVWGWCPFKVWLGFGGLRVRSGSWLRHRSV